MAYEIFISSVLSDASTCSPLLYGLRSTSTTLLAMGSSRADFGWWPKKERKAPASSLFSASENRNQNGRKCLSSADGSRRLFTPRGAHQIGTFFLAFSNPVASGWLPLTFSGKLATVCLIISFQGACRSCPRFRQFVQLRHRLPDWSRIYFRPVSLKLDGRNRFLRYAIMPRNGGVRQNERKR
jgi:hypothetical protein